MKKNVQDKFWNGFAKNYWEKKPILVKKFKSSIFEIDQIEVFRMLVEFSNQCRRQKTSAGFKLYIDGQMRHPEEVLQFLPAKSDKSLIGYHDRMESYFSDYCLVCDELLQVSQKNWNKLQEFTSTLFSSVGFPNRFVEMGLYLGNYRKTPFGVHVDGCGVFSFPVIGTKTFRLWKPSFAKKNPALDRALNYSRYKKNSTIMKASHGDMTYWPSSAWHIAESDGSFSATWSLGVWVDRPHAKNVELALKPLLESSLGIIGNETVTRSAVLPSEGDASRLPDNYKQSILKIQNISKDELHDAFMFAWLKQLSMRGFKTTHRLERFSKVFLSSEIQLPDSKRIVWAHLKSRTKILYASEGIVVETLPSRNFHKLVNALNSGGSCKVSNYLKGNKKLEDLRSLQTLLTIPKAE